MVPLLRPVASTVKTVWIIRHMLYHVCIGLVYAWVLREWWQELSFRLVTLSVVGSVLPDVDHMVYFFGYGRNDFYAKEVKVLLKRKKIRTLFSFLTDNHKENTSLKMHNIGVVILFFIVSLLSFIISFETGVILFGAMCLHLMFDMFDDFLILGSLNPNWKRMGVRRLFSYLK